MKENNVTISEEVMVTIANIATKEVEGVAGLHTGMVDSIIDKFTGTNWDKVKTSVKECAGVLTVGQE